MSRLPTSTREISQFAPSADHPKYPGVLGWGFDREEFRIVMYGPPEADHVAVKATYKHKSKNRPLVGDEEGLLEKYLGRKGRNRDRLQDRGHKHEKKDHVPRGEHPPAHIHVIDLKTGRETRFELIEPRTGNCTTTPLFLSQQRADELTDDQIHYVQAHILDQTAGLFIQLWRTMYQDKDLGRYVTRTSVYHGEEVIDRIDEKGWQVLTNHDGQEARIPPPNLDTTLGKLRPGNDPKPSRGGR